MSKRVAECPNCGFVNPDPHGLGYCPSCGAIIRDALTLRLSVVWLAALVGMAAAGFGGYLVLFKDRTALGFLLCAAGTALLGYGIWVLRKQNQAVLTALNLRGTRETMRYVTSTDIVCSLLLIFFLASILTSLVCAKTYKDRQELRSLGTAFEKEINNYTALFDLEDKKPIDPTQVILKVIVLERDAGVWRISDVQLSLPKEIKAEKPDQVGTVAWVDYETKRIGDYGGTTIPANQYKAIITLIDVKSKQVIGRKPGFAGGPPPENAPSDGSAGYGSRPTHEMAEFLAGLKRAGR